jgi:D-alanine transaminase/branched-chain amino acid aminotransferase
MSAKHAVVNGKLVNSSKATMAIVDRELQYGFGVYETLKVSSQKLIYPSEHVKRLLYSAQGIDLRHPYQEQELLSWLDQLIAIDALEHATIRILLLGGVKARLFITSSPPLTYPKSFYEEGIKAISYHGERFLPQYKTCSLLMNYLALREAGSHGAFEALLVDSNQMVLEGTRSNVFACQGNRIYTAADEKVLSGVTRQKILLAAQQLGYEIIMEPPLLKDLHSGRFEELFISSTSMAAMPVSRFDGRIISPPFVISGAICALIQSWEAQTLH